MGIWTKLFGIDERFMKIENMLADVHEHQQKIDMKMDILAHDVVGHLPSVVDENKVRDTIVKLEKLEGFVQTLATTLMSVEATTKINTHTSEINEAKMKKLDQKMKKIDDPSID